MFPTMMLLIAAAVAILAFVARSFNQKFAQAASPPPAAKARSANLARSSQAEQPATRMPQSPQKAVSTKRPDLLLLEWEPADGAEPEVIQASPVKELSPVIETGTSPVTELSIDPVTELDIKPVIELSIGPVSEFKIGPVAEPPISPADDIGQDFLRAKLRDRYIAVRFPGVARSSADLQDAERVIKGVRLYFEEQKFDRADELLELAIGQAGSDKLLRLARLELAFLRREAGPFTEFAREIRRVHPDLPEWPEVARLGRALAPTETELFGDAQGARVHDTYGPWPEMPNWLQASWDLTHEILRSDFHREMARARTPSIPATTRNAA